MRMTVNPHLQQSPGPPRLNVIFHGLMAFRDSGTQYYDVLIPQESLPNAATCPHLAKYGNPLVATLTPFEDGRSFYELQGARDGTATAARPSSSNAVILHNGSLLPQPESVRAIVRVPKPDVIRHYRGAETKDALLGQDATTNQLMIAPPDVIHEVTVFSYFFFHRPVLVGPCDDYTIPMNGLGYYNLCIYCQPLDECQEDDSGLFNNMFKVKNSGGNIQLDLFVRRLVADGYPVKTSIGIDQEELKALSELPKSVGGGVEPDPKRGTKAKPGTQVNIKTSDPGGCGSAFVCDGDGPPRTGG